jgi:hypothetical protein
MHEKLDRATNKTLYSVGAPSPVAVFSLLDLFMSFSQLMDFQYRIERFHRFSHKYTLYLRDECHIPEPFDKMLFSIIITLVVYYSLGVLKNMLGARLRG